MKKEDQFEVPADALRYITNNFLRKAQISGVAVAVGITASNVENVLELFVEWASTKGLVENGDLLLSKLKD